MNVNMDKSQEIFYKILSEHKELSSLPQVLAEVLKISSDDNSSADDLADVIMKDPALAAKLLRVVNSPFCGMAREVTSIKQAVMTLGIRTVTAIALSTSIYDLTNKIDSLINRKKFWRHSLEVAIASRMIAEKIGYGSPEEAFVAGLLHDIGVLILESSFPEEFKRIWRLVESGEKQELVEQRTWGTDHAKAGQFLLDQWGIPKKLGEAIGAHHEMIDHGEPASSKKLNLILNLANQISRFRVYSMPPPESKDLENRDVIAASLEISQEQLAKICENLVSEVIKESGYLEIKIGSLEELFLQANQLLFKQYLATENLLRENRTMKQQINRDQVKKAALESLNSLSATFSHYINNAISAILGRAELIEAGITRGEIIDKNGSAGLSSQIIIEAVDTISIILGELNKISMYDDSSQLDDSYLADFEEKIKTQLKNLEKASAPIGG
ncbi:MAG TPA: HDOD domain-containing protein [candidate division Zixibacteria bacterium]|nr:HDOD domain-containing protein [candidate division Zixibacteria bacterium]